MAYAPSGEFFVSGGADGQLLVFDGKSGAHVGEIGAPAHKGGIYGVRSRRECSQHLWVLLKKMVWKADICLLGNISFCMYMYMCTRIRLRNWCSPQMSSYTRGYRFYLVICFQFWSVSPEYLVTFPNSLFEIHKFSAIFGSSRKNCIQRSVFSVVIIRPRTIFLVSFTALCGTVFRAVIARKCGACLIHGSSQK